MGIDSPRSEDIIPVGANTATASVRFVPITDDYDQQEFTARWGVDDDVVCTYVPLTMSDDVTGACACDFTVDAGPHMIWVEIHPNRILRGTAAAVDVTAE